MTPPVPTAGSTPPLRQQAGLAVDLLRVLINVARRMAEQKRVSSTDSSPPDED